MKDEALRLALDKKADNARDLGLNYDPENTLHWHALNYRTALTQNAQKMFEALEKFVETAIKQALEQPEPEPVKVMGFDCVCGRRMVVESDNRIVASPPKRDIEAVAKWMIDRGYATGHGDTIEDLLKELEWQIRENEREACAQLCEDLWEDDGTAWDCAVAIESRGNK